MLMDKRVCLVTLTSPNSLIFKFFIAEMAQASNLITSVCASTTRPNSTTPTMQLTLRAQQRSMPSPTWSQLHNSTRTYKFSTRVRRSQNNRLQMSNSHQNLGQVQRPLLLLAQPRNLAKSACLRTRLTHTISSQQRLRLWCRVNNNKLWSHLKASTRQAWNSIRISSLASSHCRRLLGYFRVQVVLQ